MFEIESSRIQIFSNSNPFESEYSDLVHAYFSTVAYTKKKSMREIVNEVVGNSNCVTYLHTLTITPGVRS